MDASAAIATITLAASTPLQMLTELPSMCHVDLYTQSYLNHNINDIIATNEESNSNISLELTPCPICSRTFNAVTLQKHVGICEKMATKKRNVFDSSRQRREGTELAAYPLPKGFGLPPTRQDRGQSPKPTQVSSPVLIRKKPNEDLARTTARASMRKLTTSNTNVTSTVPTTETVSSVTADKTSTSVGATTPTTPAANTHTNNNFIRDRMRSSERAIGKRSIQPPAAEQCPHCERCFGIKAYDRHVEWCKEKALQASIKHNTKTEQNVAKERLEARTKYRAPCLKTKRSMNRDKYSGLTGDDNDSNDSPKSGSSNATNNNNNIMSLSMTSSIMSDTTLPNYGNITNGPQNHSINHKKSNKNPITKCHNEEMPIAINANRDVHRSNSELDMKNVHITGEKCTTLMSSNKRKDTAAVECNKYDLNKDLAKGIPFIAPRRTKSNTSIQNDKLIGKKQQDQQKEIRSDDTNDLLTKLTLFSTTTTTAGTPTLTSTKSSTSLNRRKLKTKQKSAINFTIPTMQNFEMENVGVGANESAGTSISATAAVTTEFVTNNKINNNNKLRAAKSLPQMQLTQPHQQQEQDESIFEIPKTTTTTPTIMLTKLETNPIKSPAICRPKRKKLQRQQSITSTPLKATIPLLKESIETFGLRPGNISKMLSDKKSNNINVTDLSCDNKEIRVIKAPPSSPFASSKAKAPSPPPSPPTLTRNKSFILSTTTPATSKSKEETSKDLTSSKYTELKSTISSENFVNDPEDKKREIFISIETEQNDLGHSPTSPDMLRNLVTSGVGNHSRAHVEEVCDATDNKFSKIDDDEPIAPTAPLSSSSSRSFFNATQYPNIQLNNAKNLIQKMQEDFRQMGEEVGANIRQAVMKNAQGNTELLAEQNQQRSAPVSARSDRGNDNTFSATTMPSGDGNADSDDMSSLDSYPMSSQSSRRGVTSKLSADSAYGSLSRQRSTELPTHRSLNRTRPSTASSVTNTTQTATAPMIDAATQHYQQQQLLQQQQQNSNYKYATIKNRSRQYSAGGGAGNSSSSGSDNSLPPIVTIGKHNNITSNNTQQQNFSQNQNTNNNSNRYQQQQPSATIYDNDICNSNMNNNIPFESPLSSPTTLTAAATGALSNSTPSMTASMKMSKFCHECGARFVVEQAKFCMDCGVRRIVL